MKLLSILWHRKSRFLQYLKDGYAYPALFMSLISFLGVVWLNVQDVPFVVNIFKKYYIFTITALLIISPPLVMLGWWHSRRGPVYKEQVKIQTASNPYNKDLLTEKEKLYLPLLYLLAKKVGIENKYLKGFENILKSNGVDID